MRRHNFRIKKYNNEDNRIIYVAEPSPIELYAKRYKKYGLKRTECLMNFHNFVLQYEYDKKTHKIKYRKSGDKEIIINYFPRYSDNPKHHKTYILYLKQLLIKYKPWENDTCNVWNGYDDNDVKQMEICWKKFIKSTWAKENISESIRNNLQFGHVELEQDELEDIDIELNPIDVIQQPWQILAAMIEKSDNIIVNDSNYDWYHDYNEIVGNNPNILSVLETHTQNLRLERIINDGYADGEFNIQGLTSGQNYAYHIVQYFAKQQSSS